MYKGYKQDKIEMRGDRAEMSDFPLYLNTVAGGLDCRNQAIGGFSFVVKIYAVPVVEIIDNFFICWGYMVSTLNSAIAFEMVWRRVSSSSIFLLA